MRSETLSLSDAEIGAIARRLNRPVVLVGLMGVGKSTVGRKLADLLEAPFVDADAEIEEAAQLSIPEIFEEYGEDYFRDGERRVIARLMNGGPGIIATGGGAFVQDETRTLVLEKGIAVWIDCSVETLVERTSRKNTRPLLRNGDPAEILGKLHEERRQFYEQAQVRVVSDDGPHHETAMQIIEGIDRWL